MLEQGRILLFAKPERSRNGCHDALVVVINFGAIGACVSVDLPVDSSVHE